jgi:hypothetical protein
MQVYGFDYSNIFFLLSVPAVVPVDSTGALNYNFNGVYTFMNNPNMNPPYNNPFIPTSPVNATFSTAFPNWLSTINNQLDLRGFYLNSSYGLAISYPSEVLGTTSNITGTPVAFTV